MNDLISNDQEDLLKKVTVRIQVEISCSEDILLGTGVIYFLENEENSLIITAKHCLLGNDFQYTLDKIAKLTIQNKYLNNESFATLEVSQDNIFITKEKTNDIALISISNIELCKLIATDAKEIPKIILSKDFKFDIYHSNGYPNAFFKSKSYHFLNFRYNSDQGVCFEIDSLSSLSSGTGDLAIHAIEGYSGSGLFIHNLNYLTGIIISLKSTTGQFDTAICLKIENLNAIIDFYKLDATNFQFQSIPNFSDNIGVVENKIINKNLSHSITSLKGNTNVPSDININYEYSLSSLPKLGQKFTKRKALVDEIILKLDSKVWIHFYRTVGYGKTQFANLLARSFKGEILWIKLRNTSNPISLIYNNITKGQEWIEKADGLQKSLHSFLNVPTLLILDDLPKLENKEINIEFFDVLMDFCLLSGSRIISTSNFPINNRIKEQLNIQYFEEILQPALNSHEIFEILLNNEVPNEKIQQCSEIIEIQTQGHPFIINAIISFLKSKNWEVDNDHIKQVFTYDFSPSLTQEIQLDITDSIQDSDTRELLYRLNVIHRSFTIDEVKTVSSIEPAISKSLEKFESIKDLWIQVDSESTFSVSPLLRQIKTVNLSDELTSRINYSLANKILKSTDKLNHLKIYYAINYLIAAENYNDAAIVLIRTLQEYKDHSEQFYKSLIQYFWYYGNLPKNIYVEHRINIRIIQIQISISSKRNSETLFLLQDLEAIVYEASVLGLKVTYAKILLSTSYRNINNSKSNEYLLNSIEDISNPEYREYFSKLRIPNSLIWVPLFYSETTADIKSWLTNYKKITNANFLDTRITIKTAMAISHIMYSLYNKKLSEATSISIWNNFISEIDEIIAISKECKIYLLFAYASVVKIWILCVQFSLYEDAKKYFNSCINLLKDYNDGLYVMYDGLARGFFESNLINDAFEVFEIAINIKTENTVIEQFFSLSFFSKKIYKKNIKTALKYSKKAYEFSLDINEIDLIQKAKLIGEYSFYYGSEGKYLEAIILLEKGFELLIKVSEKDNDWKALFMSYAHVFHYYKELLIKNTPPKVDMTGEVYHEPSLDYFQANYNADIINYYFDERLFLNCYLVLNAFENLGNFNIASKWANFFFQELKYQDLKAFQSIKTNIIPYLLKQNKYADAISICFVTWKSLNDFQSDINELKNILPENINLGNKNVPKPIEGQFIEYCFLNVLLNVFCLNILNELAIIEKLLADWSKKYGGEKEWVPYLKLIQDVKSLNINSEDSIQNFKSIYLESNDNHIKILGLIVSSIYTKNIESFYLQVPVFKYLEEVLSTISPGSLNFIIIPFFVDLWKNRFKDQNDGLKEHTFWYEKSLPRIENAKPSNKIRFLTQALLHHLNVNNDEVENWIQSRN